MTLANKVLGWPSFKAVALKVYEISRCKGMSRLQIHTLTVNPNELCDVVGKTTHRSR